MFSTFRSRNFSHLIVGEVYGRRRLMSKQLVEGGCRLTWTQI